MRNPSPFKRHTSSTNNGDPRQSTTTPRRGSGDNDSAHAAPAPSSPILRVAAAGAAPADKELRHQGHTISASSSMVRGASGFGMGGGGTARGAQQSPPPPRVLAAYDVIKVGRHSDHGKARTVLLREDALFFLDIDHDPTNTGIIKRHVPLSKIKSVTLFKAAASIVISLYGERASTSTGNTNSSSGGASHAVDSSNAASGSTEHDIYFSCRGETPAAAVQEVLQGGPDFITDDYLFNNILFPSYPELRQYEQRKLARQQEKQQHTGIKNTSREHDPGANEDEEDEEDDEAVSASPRLQQVLHVRSLITADLEAKRAHYDDSNVREADIERRFDAATSDMRRALAAHDALLHLSPTRADGSDISAATPGPLTAGQRIKCVTAACYAVLIDAIRACTGFDDDNYVDCMVDESTPPSVFKQEVVPTLLLHKPTTNTTISTTATTPQEHDLRSNGNVYFPMYERARLRALAFCGAGQHLRSSSSSSSSATLSTQQTTPQRSSSPPGGGVHKDSPLRRFQTPLRREMRAQMQRSAEGHGPSGPDVHPSILVSADDRKALIVYYLKKHIQNKDTIVNTGGNNSSTSSRTVDPYAGIPMESSMMITEDEGEGALTNAGIAVDPAYQLRLSEPGDTDEDVRMRRLKRELLFASLRRDFFLLMTQYADLTDDTNEQNNSNHNSQNQQQQQQQAAARRQQLARVVAALQGVRITVLFWDSLFAALPPGLDVGQSRYVRPLLEGLAGVAATAETAATTASGLSPTQTKYLRLLTRDHAIMMGRVCVCPPGSAIPPLPAAAADVGSVGSEGGPPQAMIVFTGNKIFLIGITPFNQPGNTPNNAALSQAASTPKIQMFNLFSLRQVELAATTKTTTTASSSNSTSHNNNSTGSSSPGRQVVTLRFFDDIVSSFSFFFPNAPTPSSSSSPTPSRHGSAAPTTAPPSVVVNSSDISAISNVLLFLLKREGCGTGRVHFVNRSLVSRTTFSTENAVNNPAPLPPPVGASQPSAEAGTTPTMSSTSQARTPTPTTPSSPRTPQHQHQRQLPPQSPQPRSTTPLQQQPRPPTPVISEAAVMAAVPDFRRPGPKIHQLFSQQQNNKSGGNATGNATVGGGGGSNTFLMGTALARWVLRLTSGRGWVERILIIRLDGSVYVCDEEGDVRRYFPLAQVVSISLITHWEGPALCFEVAHEHVLCIKLDPKHHPAAGAAVVAAPSSPRGISPNRSASAAAASNGATLSATQQLLLEGAGGGMAVPSSTSMGGPLTLTHILTVVKLLQPDIPIVAESYAGRNKLRNLLEGSRGHQPTAGGQEESGSGTGRKQPSPVPAKRTLVKPSGYLTPEKEMALRRRASMGANSSFGGNSSSFGSRSFAKSNDDSALNRGRGQSSPASPASVSGGGGLPRAPSPREHLLIRTPSRMFDGRGNRIFTPVVEPPSAPTPAVSPAPATATPTPPLRHSEDEKEKPPATAVPATTSTTTGAAADDATPIREAKDFYASRHIQNNNNDSTTNDDNTTATTAATGIDTRTAPPLPLAAQPKEPITVSSGGQQRDSPARGPISVQQKKQQQQQQQQLQPSNTSATADTPAIISRDVDTAAAGTATANVQAPPAAVVATPTPTIMPPSIEGTASAATTGPQAEAPPQRQIPKRQPPPAGAEDEFRDHTHVTTPTTAAQPTTRSAITAQPTLTPAATSTTPATSVLPRPSDSPARGIHSNINNSVVQRPPVMPPTTAEVVPPPTPRPAPATTTLVSSAPPAPTTAAAAAAAQSTPQPVATTPTIAADVTATTQPPREGRDAHSTTATAAAAGPHTTSTATPTIKGTSTTSSTAVRPLVETGDTTANTAATTTSTATIIAPPLVSLRPITSSNLVVLEDAALLRAATDAAHALGTCALRIKISPVAPTATSSNVNSSGSSGYADVITVGVSAAFFSQFVARHKYDAAFRHEWEDQHQNQPAQLQTPRQPTDAAAEGREGGDAEKRLHASSSSYPSHTHGAPPPHQAVIIYCAALRFIHGCSLHALCQMLRVLVGTGGGSGTGGGGGIGGSVGATESGGLVMNVRSGHSFQWRWVPAAAVLAALRGLGAGAGDGGGGTNGSACTPSPFADNSNHNSTGSSVLRNSTPPRHPSAPRSHHQQNMPPPSPTSATSMHHNPQRRLRHRSGSTSSLASLVDVGSS